MTYKIGEKVSPVIAPGIEMLVEDVQCETRYYCHWFVDGDIKNSWFGDKELQKPNKNGKMGFEKGQKPSKPACERAAESAAKK